MNKSVVKQLARYGVCMGSLALTIPCQAGPWFDQMFGVKSGDPAAVATTTAYANPSAYANPGCNSCGGGQCEQTVVQYLPQVAYRTVWEPVPVTTYRRTVSYNPANGLPMTCTQPCTSYTYQARRVPYTTFRPVYTQVPVTPAAATYAAPVAPATVPVAPPPCNSCAAGAAAGYQPSPYAQPPYATPNYAAPLNPAPTYSAPAYSAPAYSAPTPATAAPSYSQADPPGATPWERVDATTQSSIPQATTPTYPYNNGGRSTQDEADRVPRIDPSIQPEVNSLQRIPTDRDIANSRAYSTTRGFQDNYYQKPTDWAPVTPSTGSTLPGLGSATRHYTSDEPTPATASGAPTARFDLQPIPNVDSQGSTQVGPSTPPSGNLSNPQNSFRGPQFPSIPPANADSMGTSDAPPLLNVPRDRTALMQPIQTRWVSDRIHWPVNRASYEEQDTATVSQQIPPRQENSRRLDTYRAPQQRFESTSGDSQWKSSATSAQASSDWRSSH